MQCHSCSAEIEIEQPASEKFQLSIVCSNCHYVNILERYEFEINLQKMSTTYELGIQFDDSQDSKTCALALKAAASALAEKIAHQVRVNLPAARNALPIALGFREAALDNKLLANITGSAPGLTPENTQFDTRAFEVLYGILSICGGPAVQSFRESDQREAYEFLQRIGRLVGDLVGCALQASQMRRRLLSAHLVGGVLVSSKTERHARAVEWYQNRKALEKRAALPKPNPYLMVSPESAQAQRKLMGFDTNDVLKLTEKDFARLKGIVKVDEAEYVRILDLKDVPSSIRRMISYMTLTPNRLRRFRAPFFFDLGMERKQPLDDINLVIESVAFNWLYYYPFTAMTLESSGAPRLVATSRPAMVAFMTNLMESKASLLAHMVDAANDRGDLGADLAALADRAHRRLEKEIRHVALNTGWFACHIDRFRNERLSCGDIDALLAKPISPDSCIVLLCEAKDIDIAFFRDGGWEECEKKVKGAVKQLNQKANWLTKRWSPEFAQEVFGSQFHVETIIVRTLITRNYIPIDFLNGATGIPFFALPMVLKEIGELDAPAALARFGANAQIVRTTTH